jgi:hypothetical protein
MAFLTNRHLRQAGTTGDESLGPQERAMPAIYAKYLICRGHGPLLSQNDTPRNRDFI